MTTHFHGPAGCLALVALLVADGRGGEPAAERPMLIVPAPGPVAIDGDLGDWNRAGKIGPVFFDEEARDEYNGTFYAMYDREHLFLAARIVEPHPPYNTFPFKGFGDWNGDAVAIRMSSNPALRFPVVLPDAATSPELFTASFWWNHLRKDTFWAGYHGMRGATLRKEQMPGVRAAVRTAAGGKGYTMEVQVPWTLINPGFHPRPGDRIAFTWEASISNASPAQPARIFQLFANGGDASAFRDPHGWGAAVFK